MGITLQVPLKTQNNLAFKRDGAIGRSLNWAVAFQKSSQYSNCLRKPQEDSGMDPNRIMTSLWQRYNKSERTQAMNSGNCYSNSGPSLTRQMFPNLLAQPPCLKTGCDNTQKHCFEDYTITLYAKCCINKGFITNNLLSINHGEGLDQYLAVLATCFVTKHSNKNRLKKEGLIWAPSSRGQSIMTWKSRLQELRAAAILYQMNAVLSSLLPSGPQTVGWCLSQLR